MQHPAPCSLLPAPGAPAPRQSPLGFLRALSARIRSAFGADLTTDLLDEGLADITTGLERAHTSAVKAETTLARFTREFLAACADGVITLRERATLLRALLGLKRQAHHTTKTITHLRF